MAGSIDDLLKHTGEWLRGTGPVADIVMSSRIRLARNLAKTPFAVRATSQSRREVQDAVKDAVGRAPGLNGALMFDLEELTEVDRQCLVERHLVSREFIAEPEHKSIVIGPDEILALMINEEDHLRIQALQSGLNLQDAWELIDGLDDELSDLLPFAFTNDWGYLTCCPTNTGTGMRGSVMLHLPALVMTKQINKMLHTITKLGLAARGLYGEGTEATGNFFQISNQVTLGRTEAELIESIERILRQVIEHEQNARESLIANNRVQLEDRICRAFGIMRHARTMSSQETLDLLSAVRLGVDLELMNGLNRSTLNELFLLSQPAHLQKLEHKTLSARQRDETRARLIRERLDSPGSGPSIS
ncbi:MAG TPA: protein arginine kinase [bacterium]